MGEMRSGGALAQQGRRTCTARARPNDVTGMSGLRDAHDANVASACRIRNELVFRGVFLHVVIRVPGWRTGDTCRHVIARYCRDTDGWPHVRVCRAAGLGPVAPVLPPARHVRWRRVRVLVVGAAMPPGAGTRPGNGQSGMCAVSSCHESENDGCPTVMRSRIPNGGSPANTRARGDASGHEPASPGGPQTEGKGRPASAGTG